MPVYKPRFWQPYQEYPLFLINWKEASHTHTRTQHNAWLNDIKPENPLVIHPEVVGAQHGFVHWKLGRRAAGRGAGFGDLNTIAHEPLRGQGLHKEVCVRLRKA